MTAAVQCPEFIFATHPSVSSFTTSPQTYLTTHAHPQYAYIAAGALVFDTSEPHTPRILLLQRSAHDSMPDRWEIPGGGCDDEDKSILHAVARELWEEAGVKAGHIGPLVGDPHLFISRSGKKICRFNFLVEAEKGVDGRLDVRLDPNEHQRFVWASEDEVKRKKVRDVELDFTTQESRDIILASFRHIEEAKDDDKPSRQELSVTTPLISVDDYVNSKSYPPNSLKVNSDVDRPIHSLASSTNFQNQNEQSL